jgi:hypothetical protein
VLEREREREREREGFSLSLAPADMNPLQNSFVYLEKGSHFMGSQNWLEL